MSVPSSKTIVTTDRPYFEIDRTSSTFGMPDIARSTGTLTYCSTSTDESAGAAVITCTWMFVMSGTASIGSCTADRTPTATSSPVSSSTIARWRREHATTPDRKATSVLRAERALEDGALQREHPVDHDLLACAQAAEDLDAPPGRATEGDGVKIEVVVGLADEHDIPVGDARDPGERDNDALRARVGV